jgi:hypothetical protein
VGSTLDLIARLPVRVVVPGHGAPFTDVAGALVRARSRLEGFRADPRRHARHAAKVVLKYRLMETQRAARAEFVRWAAEGELMQQMWVRFGSGSIEAWIDGFVEDLAAAGAIRIVDDDVFDR